MGLLVYDAATVAFVTGVCTYFGVHLLTFVAPLLLGYAWLNVNLQVCFAFSGSS